MARVYQKLGEKGMQKDVADGWRLSTATRRRARAPHRAYLPTHFPVSAVDVEVDLATLSLNRSIMSAVRYHQALLI